MAQPSRTRVLLAHQDALLAAGIAATLTADDEFEVMRADSDASIAQARRSVDVAIADYHTAVEQTLRLLRRRCDMLGLDTQF
jgi:DNA-binding NarL/FixJ family response regulator